MNGRRRRAWYNRARSAAAAGAPAGADAAADDDSARRSRAIATNDIALPRVAETPMKVASLRARTGGYVVDMVIFAAVTMIVFVAAGLYLLLSTGWATHDPGDAKTYAFLAIIGLGTPIAWSAMNLLLLAMRGQTGGQYVAGVRLQREDGGRLSLANAAGWWFLLNPLLFSWPMALVAGLPLAGAVAVVLSRVTVGVFGVIIVLCLLAPIIALVSAAIDRQNRTLHDRIIGTVAVPVD